MAPKPAGRVQLDPNALKFGKDSLKKTDPKQRPVITSETFNPLMTQMSTAISASSLPPAKPEEDDQDWEHTADGSDDEEPTEPKKEEDKPETVPSKKDKEEAIAAAASSMMTSTVNRKQRLIDLRFEAAQRDIAYRQVKLLSDAKKAGKPLTEKDAYDTAVIEFRKADAIAQKSRENRINGAIRKEFQAAGNTLTLEEITARVTAREEMDEINWLSAASTTLSLLNRRDKDDDDDDDNENV